MKKSYKKKQLRPPSKKNNWSEINIRWNRPIYSGHTDEKGTKHERQENQLVPKSVFWYENWRVNHSNICPWNLLYSYMSRHWQAWPHHSSIADLSTDAITVFISTRPIITIKSLGHENGAGQPALANKQSMSWWRTPMIPCQVRWGIGTEYWSGALVELFCTEDTARFIQNSRIRLF
jgi:hypothetical protein